MSHQHCPVITTDSQAADTANALLAYLDHMDGDGEQQALYSALDKFIDDLARKVEFDVASKVVDLFKVLTFLENDSNLVLPEASEISDIATGNLSGLTNANQMFLKDTSFDLMAWIRRADEYITQVRIDIKLTHKFLRANR